MISARAGLPCILLYIFAVTGLYLPACHGQTGREPPSTERLLRSVADYLKSLAVRDTRPSRYIYTFVHLSNEDRAEAVVYLSGDPWCGSGGCTILILNANDAGFKVISHLPATKLPIRLLKAKSHGWHDLAVWRHGSGINYEERLVYDGVGYWFSSSDVKGRRAVGQEEGKVILSSKDKEAILHP
jgi:hypothetical protein